MGLLLNGVGDLVKKDKEKAKVLNAFLTSVCSYKTPFRNLRSLRTVEGPEQERLGAQWTRIKLGNT